MTDPTWRSQATIVQVYLDDLRSILADAQRPAAPTLLDSAACARELSISVSQLSTLIAQGLPFVRVGDRRRFEIADVLSWLRARGGKCESEPVSSTSRAGGGTPASR